MSWLMFLAAQASFWRRNLQLDQNCLISLPASDRQICFHEKNLKVDFLNTVEA